jgi:hypothetical protein
MPASVAREKCDLASFEFAENERIGGRAEGRFDALLTYVGEPRHRVESAAADDADFCAGQDMLLQENAQGLNVKFQDVVVHSVENWEANVAKQKLTQETEWTITIMLD